MPGKKKQTTLTLSFKDDEMWIYQEICKHSGKGTWVKDVLKEYLRGNTKESPQSEQKINSFLDF